MNKLSRIIISILLLPSWVYGQELLELEEAVALALEKNYDIQLADKSLEKSENNKSIYNSGYLPSASVDGNGNYSNSNLRLTSFSGDEQSLNNIATKSLGGSVGLNYLIFNGGQRKFQYDKFKMAYELAGVQKRIQIETTILNVYTTYFSIAKSQEQKNVLEETYKYSKDRLERVIALKEQGKKSHLEVLNAQVDANADSLQVMIVSNQLENQKRNLNLILGKETNYDFGVSTEVTLDSNLVYNILLEEMLGGNMQIKEIELQKSVAEYDVKMNKSGYLPSLSTSASYSLNYGDNGPVSIYPYQTSNGLSVGLTLSWNIFDGGARKVKVQNSLVDIEIQSINEQKLKSDLENKLANYWADYLTQKAIIQNEEINEEVNRLNLSQSTEQFDLGKISSFELRQAQINLINTQLNLLNAKYDAKLLELQIKLLAVKL